MTDYQMRRVERVAYSRALRAVGVARDGSAAVVYHTNRLRWARRYADRKTANTAR